MDGRLLPGSRLGRLEPGAVTPGLMTHLLVLTIPDPSFPLLFGSGIEVRTKEESEAQGDFRRE